MISVFFKPHLHLKSQVGVKAGSPQNNALDKRVMWLTPEWGLADPSPQTAHLRPQEQKMLCHFQ